jgi:Virulence-associated protein E
MVRLRAVQGEYQSGEERGGHFVAHYIYKDRDGNNYLRVTRTADKQFPQSHWDGQRWQWGKPVGPKIPYLLPELLAAAPDTPVIICEGEKDADSVARLGLVATSAPEGAGKWKRELNQWFKGKQTVYVLEDNDDPGRAHARKVADNLDGVVSELRIVSLPNLAENGDVSDWIAAHATNIDVDQIRTELLRLCAATPLYIQTTATKWSSPLPDLTKDGAPRATLPNTKTAIELLGIECRYDLFKLQYSINGEVLDAYMTATVDDPALLRLREMVHERFGFDPTTDTVHTAVMTLANHHRQHPVRDYLDSLQWDRQPRLDLWLTSYAGVEDTPFVRAVGSLTLIAAVRRVRQPGIKFDEWLVLQGEQGNAKSQALQLLAVRPEWFSDQRVIGLSGRDAIEALSGRWIIEAAELHGMKNSDVEALKAFQSRDTDRGRLAYARTPIEAKRQCVIIGTTNSDTFLRDLTGNRRWWPVTTGTFDLEALKRDRDQLWAEAAAREASGESIRLPEALWPVAAEQQQARVIDNPFTTTLEERLRGHPIDDENTAMTGIITSESLWVLLEIRPGQRSQLHNENLGAAMKELGWKKTRRRVAGRVAHVYQRGDDDRHITAYPGREGEPPFASYDTPIPGQ